VKGEEAVLPDFLIPRMGAGTTYFSLAVIRQLEQLGVYCLNRATPIEVAQDKLHHLQLLAAHKVPLPKTILVQFPFDADLVETTMGFPAVVKTLAGSQGSGVHLCKEKQELVNLLQMIEASNPSAQLLIKEFVATSKGRDLRVVTVGGRVIAAMERVAKSGFKANVSQGGGANPFEVSSELEWRVLETVKLLELDVAGVDLLFTEQGFMICEINSSPGFEGLENACEVDIPAEIYKFLQVRFRVPLN